MPTPGFHRKLTVGVVGAGLSAGTMLWSYRAYVRGLGYDTYGVWLLLTTVVTFLQLGSVGLTPAVAKLVAEALGVGDREAARVHIRTALLAVSACAVILATSAAVLVPLAVPRLGLAPAQQTLIVGWAPWVAALSAYAIGVDTFTAILPGAGRIDLQHWCQTLMTVTTAVVSVVLLHAGMGVQALLIGQMAGYLAQHLMAALCTRAVFADLRLWRGRPSMASLRRLVDVGHNLIGSSVLQVLFVPVNRVLLAQHAGPAAVSIYELAYNGSMRFRNLFETGLRAVMPEVSRLSAVEPDPRAITRLHGQAMKLLWIVVVPIYAAVWLVAPALIQAWLGDRATATLIAAFRVTMAGALVSLFAVPAYYVLLGLGRTRPLFVEKLVQLGLALALVAGVLVPTHRVGAVTVSSAVAFGMAVSAVYLRRAYHLHLGAIGRTDAPLVASRPLVAQS